MRGSKSIWLTIARGSCGSRSMVLDSTFVANQHPGCVSGCLKEQVEDKNGQEGYMDGQVFREQVVEIGALLSSSLRTVTGRLTRSTYLY